MKFGTYSLRRTKAVLSRRTGNPSAVQLLLGPSKVESVARYLGIKLDDASNIAEKMDIWRQHSGYERTWSASVKDADYGSGNDR